MVEVVLLWHSKIVLMEDVQVQIATILAAMGIAMAMEMDKKYECI